MKRFWNDFCRDERGQDLVEYALALGMVAVAAVCAMPGLSEWVDNAWQNLCKWVTTKAGK